MNRAQLLWSADSEGLKSNAEVGAALNNICVLNVCVYTVEVGAVLTFFFVFLEERETRLPRFSKRVNYGGERLH